jgi:putative membrane protein
MRALLLCLGSACLLAVWALPLQALLPGPFAAHMTMHMGVVAVAAPLLALGLAGTRLDATRRWPALFAPIPWSIVELVAVWAFHTPALHHAARHSVAGLVIEQVTFLASGLLLWLSACGGRARGGARSGAGVVALLLTSMHMTLLGALLALAPRPLYAHAAHSGHADPGQLDPLADQHLGGAIMLLGGGASYLMGGLWLTAALLRQQRRAVGACIEGAG